MVSTWERLQLWAATMALIAAQFVTVVLFVEHGVATEFKSVLAAIYPGISLTVGVAALLVIGTLISRWGYYQHELRLVQFIGTALVLGAYGIVGEQAIVVYDVQAPVESLQLLGVAVVVYLSVLFWYASLSAQQFAAWDAKAVIVLIATALLVAGGYFAPSLFIGAFIVAFIPMMMHMFHIIGLFEQASRIKPIRHGMRLYIAIVAFYIELSLYFLRAFRMLV